jgi:hypothetical protein
MNIFPDEVICLFISPYVGVQYYWILRLISKNGKALAYKITYNRKEFVDFFRGVGPKYDESLKYRFLRLRSDYPNTLLCPQKFLTLLENDRIFLATRTFTKVSDLQDLFNPLGYINYTLNKT